MEGELGYDTLASFIAFLVLSAFSGTDSEQRSFDVTSVKNMLIALVLC
jgi:hypothetical protein